MNKPGVSGTSPSPVRQPVLLGLFTGTAIGAGYLLAAVPNVELMTLIIAAAGATLGAGPGAACGAVAALAYSLGSPLGLPVPLLLAGQIFGLGLAGVFGGALGPPVFRALGAGRRLRSMILAGAAGVMATLVYDLVTNLAIIGAFAMSPQVVLAGAVPFVLIHVGVNATIFALLFPALVGRLHGLAESPFRGQGRAMVVMVALGAWLFWGPDVAAQEGTPAGKDLTGSSAVAVAPVDSLPRMTVEPGPAPPLGWSRPLWDPYAPTTLQWLGWRSGWIPLSEGGLGAATVILGEAGTSSSPAFERDGIPLGTGHVLADDPWLISNQGLKVSQQQMGLDPRTGADGQISLSTDDPTPDEAFSMYRGSKGPHETYHRGISLMTPRTAWRLAFEFDESLDNEGYNFSDDPDLVFRDAEPFAGHAKVRTSRTRLVRNLDTFSSLALEYSTGRKTKDLLPAWGAEHQEVWASGAAATMKTRAAGWLWRTAVYWNSQDVRWGDRPTSSGPAADSRLLETVREGLTIDLIPAPAPPDSGSAVVNREAGLWQSPDRAERTFLGIRLANWDVQDTGASWAAGSQESASGTGQTAHLAAQSGLDLGPGRLQGGLNASWDSYGGVAPGGTLGLLSHRSDLPWKIEFSQGGRAPRSDELLTPMDRDVNGSPLFILPNSDLHREKTWRLQAVAGTRLMGFNLAVDGSLRRLQDGITWVPESGSPDTGRWANRLEMNTSRLTGSVGRQGRFLGWGRIRLEGTWQSFEETAGQAVLLPPEQYFRMELMWENHFFREDGILQLALFSTRRGEMADPWDLTRSTLLPEATWHDLLLGFRLVGTNLSLAIRNLTDQQVRLSAGAISRGREMDLRLHWVFHY